MNRLEQMIGECRVRAAHFDLRPHLMRINGAWHCFDATGWARDPVMLDAYDTWFKRRHGK